MGQMDTFTKEYLRRDRVFADLVNMALFHGKARISPGNLQEVDTTSEAIVISFDTQRSSNITLIRDIIKKVTWNTDYGQFIYVGIENQTAIDYAMPLRVSASSDLFWFRDMRVMQGKLRENRHVRDLLTSVPKGTTIPMMVAIDMTNVASATKRIGPFMPRRRSRAKSQVDEGSPPVSNASVGVNSSAVPP